MRRHDRLVSCFMMLPKPKQDAWHCAHGANAGLIGCPRIRAACHQHPCRCRSLVWRFSLVKRTPILLLGRRARVILTLASLSPELARKSALASSGLPYSCFVVEGCCTQSNRSGAKRGGERMCGTGSDDGILILFTADGWADRAVAQAWAALGGILR